MKSKYKPGQLVRLVGTKVFRRNQGRKVVLFTKEFLECAGETFSLTTEAERTVVLIKEEEIGSAMIVEPLTKIKGYNFRKVMVTNCYTNAMHLLYVRTHAVREIKTPQILSSGV